MINGELPEKPLYASVSTDNKILKKEKVYFFKREDNSIIATTGPEAWSLYARRPQVIGKLPQRFELVGTGDGEIFLAALKEAQKQTDVNKAREIIMKGQQDEYEACKGKIQPPPNYDKFGDGASFI